MKISNLNKKGSDWTGGGVHDKRGWTITLFLRGRG